MTDLRVEALFDFWKFVDLIDAFGGSSTFYELQHRMADINVRPQTCGKDTFPPRLWRKRIFLLHRDSRKSTVLLTLYTLWRLYRNPDLRILVGCNELDLAVRFIKQLRQFFEDEYLQTRVWHNRPHIKGPLVPALTRSQRGAYRKYKANLDTDADDRKISWSNTELQLIRTKRYKEPSVGAYSVGTSVTGDHFDLLILDDVVNWKNSATERGSQNVIRWVADLQSVIRKAPTWTNITPQFGEWVGGEIVVIGTLYYRHDLYHQFICDNDTDVVEYNPEHLAAVAKRKGYTLLYQNIYKNNTDTSDGYAFPQEFNDDVIDEIQQDPAMSRSIFSAQFLLKTSEEVSGTLDPSLVRFVVSSHLRPQQGHCVVWDGEERTSYTFPVYLVVDPAISMKAKADNTAIGVGGISPVGKFYLLELVSGKFTPTETIVQVYKLIHKYGLKEAYIESGRGYQAALLHTFRDKFGKTIENVHISPILLHAIVPMTNKAQAIEYAIEPYLVAGLFFTLYNIWTSTPLESELKYFSANGSHDDCVDVVQKLINLCKPQRNKKGSQRVTRNALRGLQHNKLLGGCR